MSSRKVPPPPIRWAKPPGTAQAKRATAPPVQGPARPPAAHVVQACRQAATSAVRAALRPAPGVPATAQCRLPPGAKDTLEEWLSPKIKARFKYEGQKLTFNWEAFGMPGGEGFELPEEPRSENYQLLAGGLRKFHIPVSWENLNELAGIAAALEEKRTGVSRSLSWLAPNDENVFDERSVGHLDTFHSDESTVLKSHDPQKVRGLFRVNGSTIPEITASDTTLENAIKNPGNLIANTQSDGEVPWLIKALKSFKSYMDGVNNTAEKIFTLTLVGPHGPCNDCRQRIEKFVDLWQTEAAARLPDGTSARLVVTSKYSQAPHTERNLYYGWPSDSNQAGPYLHTIVALAKGRRE